MKIIDVVECHNCKQQIDVTAQVEVFNKYGNKQMMIKHCESCGVISHLVVNMVHGIISTELLKNFKV